MRKIAPGLQTLTVKMGDLQLDPRNARAHDQRNIDAIAASLSRFGQQKPIVVTADGVIVAGNGQFVAAQALGWTEIAALRTTLKGAERTAYALADNRTAELATWDQTMLAELIDELQAEDETLLDAVGFGDDLDALLASTAQEHVEFDAHKSPEKVPEQWAIVIDCAGEKQQIKLLKRFAKEGFTCRAVIS